MDNDQYNQYNDNNSEKPTPDNDEELHDDQSQADQSQGNHEETENTGQKEHAASDNYRQNPQPKKKRSKIGSGFVGGLVGGLITIGLALLLIANNVIPGISVAEDSNTDTSQPSQTASNDTSDDPNIVSTVSDGSGDVATGIDEASKAVVGVVNLQQQDIWEPSKKAGTGSGIVYKKENGKAYVVTNEHVVSDNEGVEVVLNDEKHVDAKVLGKDNLTDLAVLTIDGDKVDKVAKIGSSDNLNVGDTVLAIGNPLGMEFANSLTKGIVSGLDRSVSMDTTGNRQPDWVSQVIQTDTAVNPGNSGGALVNSKGEVVGINSMKIAKQTVEGMSFAIPIDTALPIMEQLEEDGEVARPFIGISMVELNQVPTQYRSNVKLPEDQNSGVVVAKAEQGSPADKAGLQQFDVITKIDGEKVENVVDLRTHLYRDTNIGDKVKLEIYRDGNAQTVELELTKRDE